MKTARWWLPVLGMLAACDDSTRPRDPASAIALDDTVMVAEADSTLLTAGLVTAAGDTMPDQRVAWIADDSSIATVTAGGWLHFRRPGVTSVVALADGLSRAAVARSVISWQRIVPEEQTHGRRPCGLSTRGAYYCIVVGSDTTARDLDVRLAGLTLGSEFRCGLAADSTAWCEGNNSSGELGNSAVPWFTDTLVRAAAPLKFIALVASNFRTCGIASDSLAWCWGYGSPVARVPGGHKLTAIDVHDEYACAVTLAGQVVCWGSNDHAQLGQPAGPASPTPLVVPGVTGATSVSTGNAHACAVAATGALFCWGRNLASQQGRACSSPCAPGAVTLPAVRRVAVSSARSCAITTTGRVWCWGGSFTGDGTAGARATPVPITTQGNFSDVAVRTSSCMLRDDGMMFCWGSPWGNVPVPLPFQP